jgi:hypothetical protein
MSWRFGSMGMRVWLIASAFLCVVTGALWTIGSFRELGFTFSRHGVLWELTCRSGKVLLDNAAQRNLGGRTN